MVTQRDWASYPRVRHRTTPVLPDLRYPDGKFNLTALLGSGQFHLDEMGVLVSANGTRYRIPSGPPEGRKPLRLDPKQQQQQHLSSGIKATGFPDVNVPALSDSQERSDMVDDTKRPSVFIPFEQKWTTASPIFTSHLSRTNKADLDLQVTADNQLDTSKINGSVIPITLILNSVVFVCNMVLVVVMIWKLCHRHESQKIPVGSGYEKSKVNVGCNHQRIPIFPGNYQTGKYTGLNLKGNNLQIPVVLTRSTDARIQDRSLKPRLNGRNEFPSNESGLMKSTLSDRYSGKPNHQRFASSYGKRRKLRPYNNNRWPATTVSDGMVSETTEDDLEDDRESSEAASGTNSDTYVNQYAQSRGQYYQFNRYRSGIRRPPRRIVYHCSDSSDNCLYEQRSRLDERRALNQDETPIDLDSLQQTIREQALLLTEEQSMCLYLLRTTSLHIGILGILLSLIQLFVLCNTLNKHSISRSRGGFTINQTPASDLVCILSVTLAADTILCARQYTICALLIVIGRSLRGLFKTKTMTPNHNLQHTMNSVIAHPANQVVPSNEQISRQFEGCHQRYAVLTLIHSVPWAVAVGTALLIKYAPVSSQGLSVQTNEMVNSTSYASVNFFFRGLDLLIKCNSKNLDLNLSFYSFPFSLPWFPSFLLVFLPTCVQLIVSVVNVVILHISRRSQSAETPENIQWHFLLTILLLVLTELLSCIVPVMWNIASSGTPSNFSRHQYIYRLAILNLITDPWLLIYLVHWTVNRKPAYLNAQSQGHADYLAVDREEYGGRPTPSSASLDSKEGYGKPLSRTIGPAEERSLEPGANSFPLAHVTCAGTTNKNQGSISSLKPVLVSCVPSCNIVLDNSVSRHNLQPTFAFGACTTICLPFLGNNANTAMEVNNLFPVNSSVPFIQTSVAAFPQLCKHHQFLLDQHCCSQSSAETGPLCEDNPLLTVGHSNTPPRSIADQPLRQFGMVPRLGKQVNCHPEKRPKMVSLPASESVGDFEDRTSNDCSTVQPNELTSISEEDHNKQSLSSTRQSGGKSTATAVVMAAAAAAVAAQTRTMTTKTVCTAPPIFVDTMHATACRSNPVHSISLDDSSPSLELQMEGINGQ